MRAAPRRRLAAVLAAVVLAGGALAAGLWLAWPQAEAPVAAAVPVDDAAAPGLEATRPLTLPEWLAGHSKDWRVGRLQDHPGVLVIEFPGLAEQGATMNRLAALLEKAGAPRDRVLDDHELAALITRDGDNAQTFYQGHDYDAAGLARFFGLAQRQQLVLNAREQRLRRLLVEHGLLAETPQGLQPRGLQAVITFTAVQPDDPATPIDETIDERRRESVLRHEYSHGLFFTRPAYREHSRRLWREMLTEPQREAMRRFLADLGYDRANEELMLNEAQALLLHTPDTRAFDAASVGLPAEALAELRTRFWRSLPPEVSVPAAASATPR